MITHTNHPPENHISNYKNIIPISGPFPNDTPRDTNSAESVDTHLMGRLSDRSIATDCPSEVLDVGNSTTM